MAEPLFGSIPQLWPAMPVPAFGYGPTFMASGKTPMTASTGLPSNPATPFTGFAGNAPFAQPPDVSGFAPHYAVPQASAGWPGSASFGGIGLSGAEFGGITASALLAAVALRRGQPLGPTNDQETEDFICDALDLIPGANDVEVRFEGGRAILTGTVPNKRLKRDVGEIAWTIPSVNDVHNTVSIAARRRARGPVREGESPAGGTSRKQS